MPASVAGVEPATGTEIRICAWSLGVMPTTTNVADVAKIQVKRGSVTQGGLRLKASGTAKLLRI